jgi:hypothetical protein
MRTRSTLLVLLLAACNRPMDVPERRGLVLLPPEPVPGKEVDPRPYYHDFGHVPDGEVVEHVFRMRNEDPVPVAITRIIPGCGCTVPSVRAVLADGSVVPGLPVSTKEQTLVSVPPGAMAEVALKIETGELSTKNTDKLVTIAVSTDSPGGYYVNLEVHILVEKPFSVVPNTLGFGLVPESGGGAARVEIVAVPGYENRVVQVIETPPGMQVEIAADDRGARPLWTIDARLAAPLERGLLQGNLRLATVDTKGAPGRELVVPWKAQVVADLVSEPERLVCVATREEVATATVELRSLLAGHRLRATGVEVPEEHRAILEATLEPVEPDDTGAAARWKVELRTRPPLGAETPLTGEITVRLDDPQHPSAAIAYAVHVK